MVLSKGFSKTIASTTRPDRPYSGLPTLLLVDDEPEIIASLADMYRRSYHVLTASSADEALSVLKKQTVSVIVADQRMPGKTGSELLAEALKIDSDAVRILLTGYADIEAVIQAVNQGKVYFYLTKPWCIDEMDTVITRAIEHNRLLKANRQLVEELRISNIPRVIQLVDTVRQAFGNNAPSIMLGGGAFRMIQELPEALSGCQVGLNLHDALDLTRSGY